MVSGMVRIRRYFLAAHDKGQGDAGVAAGGLDDEGFRVMRPWASRRLDHGRADAVLDAAQGVHGFDLGGDDAGQALGRW